MIVRQLLAVAILVVASRTLADETPTVVTDGVGTGTITHEVASPFQAGTLKLLVLVPDDFDSQKKYPVVYVLPTGMNDNTGLFEIRRLGLHNQHQAIFVNPSFSDWPWFNDHPTDLQKRQESYLLKVVVPYIDEHYPVKAERAGRFMIGYSKSGWGACTLLLRHPELFERAVVWDSPLMMDWPSRHGSEPIFGTQENFEQYQVSRLLEQQAQHFQTGKRFVLIGYDRFRQEMQDAHALMDKLKIDHVFQDGPYYKHAWHTGWLPHGVEQVFAPAGKD